MAKIKREHPNPVDAHVGSRVRLRRTLLGLSQDKLSEALGVTFQQVQKYENGSNRIGASRLFQMACALGVSVDFFFEGYENNSVSAVSEEKSGLDGDVLNRKETLDLVRAYYAIEEETVRRKIFDMIKSLGSSSSTPITKKAS